MPHSRADATATHPRRRAPRLAMIGVGVTTALILALGTTSCTANAGDSTAASATAKPPATAVSPAQIKEIVNKEVADNHFRAAIVRVTVDGKEVVTYATGESLPGQPATTDMHFRNGAVAISYVATLLLQLVEKKVVSLDDTVAKWLPQIPHGDQVTLRQLAQMTSGYPDYVFNTDIDATLAVDPFRQWTPDELLKLIEGQPLLYQPGTNWNYAHTNYVILGLVLEKATGTPMQELLQKNILGPLKLKNTKDPGTPAIAEPVLHAYSSERRSSLGIPDNVPFYEESTFWNPSWTITHGAIQYSTIADLTTTARAVGTGTLLSKKMHELQVSDALRGFGTPMEGKGNMFTQSVGYTYGYGIIRSGSWIMQNPAFSGESGFMAYLPSKKIAIAGVVTFAQDAYDAQGNTKASADVIFRQLGAALAPDDAPPMPRKR